MIRTARLIACVSVLLALLAGPVAAAPVGPAAGTPSAVADHLGGTFTICGRVTAFTAPMIGTPGSLTVAGVVGGAEHTFPITETATVDALVAPLAAAGEWTCLDVVGDGMGDLTSIDVPAATARCGPISEGGGVFEQGEGFTHEFTTVVLDGDAATLIGADAMLEGLLMAVATLNGAAEACLDIGLAADGTLASLALDYAVSPGSDLTAPIACGAVGGTAIPYRDPASQVYPEGTTVTVDGFSVDAALVDGPHQGVLSFHLDAGLDLCLLARVVDSVIVEVAVLTGVSNAAEVCGELEVIGGLAFVDTVVVPQGLTGLNFAGPTPSQIDAACAGARAEEDSAAGHLAICGDFEAVTETTFTVSGIAFHLQTSIDDDNAPAVGGPQGILLQGPIDPYAPFGPANPATLTATPLSGCAGATPVPDTSMASSIGSLAAGLAALIVVLAGAANLASARTRRH